MKKFNLQHIIIILAAAVCCILAFTAPQTLALVILPVLSVYLLHKEKAWGCIFGVGGFAYIMIKDYLENYLYDWHGVVLAAYNYCIPAITFFVLWAVIVRYRHYRPERWTHLYRAFYFIPVAAYLVVAWWMGGVRVFDMVGIWSAVCVMVTAGVAMSMDKLPGALGGAAFCVVWGLTADRQVDWRYTPLDTKFWIPAVVFYLCCAGIIYIFGKRKKGIAIEFPVKLKQLYNVKYFIPPILLVAISYLLSGRHAFATAGMWVAVAVMAAAGYAMCRKLVWGAWAGAAFWLVWGASAHLLNYAIPWRDCVLDFIITLPMAAIYIVYAFVMKKKQKPAKTK